MACPLSNPAEALPARFEMSCPLSNWWFGTFFIFPYIGNNHPNWLIFFRGVQTTNQQTLLRHFHLEWLVHFQSQPKHFQPDFFFSRVWNGLSTLHFSLNSCSRGFGMACRPGQSSLEAGNSLRPSQVGSPAVLYMLWTWFVITDYISDYGFDCLGFLTRNPGSWIKVRPAGIWYRPEFCWIESPT